MFFFVSHGFASVSHPKFLFRFEAKQAKLGGQFRYFVKKSFAMFRFSFASKRNLGTPLSAPCEPNWPEIAIEGVQRKCFRLKFYSPLLSKNSVETARFRTYSLVRTRKHFKMFLEVREA